MKKYGSLLNFSYNFSLKLSPIHSINQFFLQYNCQSPSHESPFDYYSIQSEHQDLYFSNLSNEVKKIWPENYIENIKDSIEDNKFENLANFKENFTQIYSFPNEEIEIIVIGVSHLFQESATSVMNMIERFQPDSVVLELCENRKNRIEDQKSLFIKKYLNVLSKNPNSIHLIFQRGLEMAIGVLKSQRLNKNCQIISGDFDENLNLIKSKEYSLKCQCKDIDFMKSIKCFIRLCKILIKSYFLKIFNKNCDHMNELISISEDFQKINKNCITNKLNLEREMNMLINLMFKSNGNRRICVMGLNHINNFDTLMKLYMEEFYFKINNEIYQKIIENDMEFTQIEELEEYLTYCDEREKQFFKKFNEFLLKKKFCNHI